VAEYAAAGGEERQKEVELAAASVLATLVESALFREMKLNPGEVAYVLAYMSAAGAKAFLKISGESYGAWCRDIYETIVAEGESPK
jgi:hypothetical protein